MMPPSCSTGCKVVEAGPHVAADFERGPSIRPKWRHRISSAMAFGAAGKAVNAEAFGRITALEARAIGVHLNFFPVAT